MDTLSPEVFTSAGGGAIILSCVVYVLALLLKEFGEFGEYLEDNDGKTQGPLNLVIVPVNKNVSSLELESDLSSILPQPSLSTKQQIKPCKQQIKSKPVLKILSRIPASRPCYNFPQTLIIATDATPRNVGGYLINQFTSRVEFYATPTYNIPGGLQNPFDSSEFEMKNLFSALLLWEHVILEFGQVAIFTDNSAVAGVNSADGRKVRSFIQHLENCEQVSILNSSWIYANSRKNPDIFDEFIVPADHLSRLSTSKFKSHILSYHPEFDLNNIRRIHFDPICERTMYWTTNKCKTCGFHISKDRPLKSRRA